MHRLALSARTPRTQTAPRFLMTLCLSACLRLFPVLPVLSRVPWMGQVPLLSPSLLTHVEGEEHMCALRLCFEAKEGVGNVVTLGIA